MPSAASKLFSGHQVNAVLHWSFLQHLKILEAGVSLLKQLNLPWFYVESYSCCCRGSLMKSMGSVGSPHRLSKLLKLPSTLVLLE